MDYQQAIKLRDELTIEGNHKIVYVDKCSHRGSSGVETIALKTEPRVDESGQVIQHVIEEVHHLNYDRTGAIVI